MTETVTLIVGVLTAATLFAGLVGLLARLLLLPWLRSELVKPVQETARQVRLNGHVSDPPTLKDDVHALTSDVAELRDDLRTAARMFEGHIERSSGEWTRVWRAIDTMNKKENGR